MLAQFQTEALKHLKRELNGLGYVGSLIQEDYEFADVLSKDISVNRIPLAAFAQDPPSYRSAAFGVDIANGRSGPELVQTHRALGAHQIFEVNNNRILRWKVNGEGEPFKLGEIDIEQLSQVFEEHKNEWTPQRVLGAKSNASQAMQLDFFDMGLLPLLEHEARTKLDHQLSGAVNLAIKTFKHQAQFTDDLYPLLFRLIFRLIAAKMLGDRRHPGDWNADNARSALRAVEKFYFKDGIAEPALEDPATQQKTWEWIKQTCHFQNLSVDSLAYVYENTLVTQETRKAYGTHSTPYAIAEYIVRNLPFEDLDQNERRVFEPFSGHSIFLIAAMQRMRELLPSEMSTRDRHEYFVKMLSGIENDEFALEVGRLSLMLADYPNPDGWRIHKADAFASAEFSEELNQANIILCNPPFERFEKGDENKYTNLQSDTKPAEVLRRVLEKPPQLLGFVLPRSFVAGRGYKQLRSALGCIYNSFELLALPDKVFAHSKSETVVLLSTKRKDGLNSLTVGQVFSSNLQDFYTTHQPSYRAREIVKDPATEFSRNMWLPPLKEVWDATREFQTLGELADIHRGIEYNQRLGGGGGRFVSSTMQPGFRAGLHKVKGSVEPFIVVHSDYLQVSPQFMRGFAYRHRWDDPKLIVNSTRQSRGNWKITASIDRSHLVCYQNFHAIWPKGRMPLEVLAAILNGPVANAFISTRASSRDVHIETLKNIPIPKLDQIREKTLSLLVQQYADTRGKWLTHELEEGWAKTECLRLMSTIDAEVLEAYGFTIIQKRALLDWFTGSTRLGPIKSTKYLPQPFMLPIPWHQYSNEASSTMPIVETLSEKTRLSNELQADFVAAPVEDGMEHEAERTLSRALSVDPNEDLLHWISEFCTDVTRPAFASSILRCLANLDNPGTPTGAPTSSVMPCILATWI